VFHQRYRYRLMISVARLPVPLFCTAIPLKTWPTPATFFAQITRLPVPLFCTAIPLKVGQHQQRFLRSLIFGA
jgi:hypothetical protein